MTAALTPHGLEIPFPVVDDSLQVGGVPLARVVEKAGGTPFYVYDRALLDRRVAALRQHIPSDVELHYAVKANPMPSLVGHMSALVDGFDVASAGELRVALATPMSPQHMSFAGPGKRTEELQLAIDSGVLINLESERELENVARLSARTGRQARVAVRINPDFELKSSGMKMGGRPTQFGVDAERVPAMLARIGELGLDFCGFHVFSGSQNLRHEAIVEAQSLTFDLAFRLASAAPAPVRLLNIGGGFGIPYFPGERPLDLTPIGASLSRQLPEVKRRLPEAKVVIELGRYLVGEAGLYVCRVLDRKVSKGSVFLITDGGLHHHLAASGNFGQVIRKNYPVVIGNKVRGARREIVTVVGPLCTPLDTLAERVEMAVAEPGDLVAVLQSGAYGRTASPVDFLSHPHPVELLI
jgi:diaminopimelate decarboxylase